MTLEATLRREMHGIYMRDPVLRERLFNEACVRHAKVYERMASRGELTPEFMLQDMKNLHEYFFEGGWEMTSKRKAKKEREPTKSDGGLNDEPNYAVGCMNCGETPTVGNTELCGPCCFGEADTVGGNW